MYKLSLRSYGTIDNAKFSIIVVRQAGPLIQRCSIKILHGSLWENPGFGYFINLAQFSDLKFRS